MGEDNESKSVSDTVAEFYDRYGWVDQGQGILGDHQSFRRFPPPYSDYSPKCMERTVALFSNKEGSLLIVGGGNMPDSHCRIAARFQQVTCLDISTVALDLAKQKLGNMASFRHESILETSLPSHSFDAVLCAHVVYHIDKDLQENAVRQMIRLAKSGGRIIIIYANPWSIFMLPGAILREIHRIVKRPRPLYYYAYPLSWWKRFTTDCHLTLAPWEVIGGRQATALLRTKLLATEFFKCAAWFEKKAPRIAVKLWQYPIVILDKK